MRKRSVESRQSFFRGVLVGLLVVLVKLLIVLPVDIADILYGIVILVTLVITIGEIVESRYFVLGSKTLDFIVGFLFPLDCYAVLILFGLPLTN
jgi:hypothetical protein